MHSKHFFPLFLFCLGILTNVSFSASADELADQEEIITHLAQIFPDFDGPMEMDWAYTSKNLAQAHAKNNPQKEIHPLFQKVASGSSDDYYDLENREFLNKYKIPYHLIAHNYEMEKFINQWLDYFHNLLQFYLHDYGYKLTIPMPNAILKKSNNLNAFVYMDQNTEKTHKQIVFNTALFQTSAPHLQVTKDFILVLVHELGHYYLNHGKYHDHEFFFYYDADALHKNPDSQIPQFDSQPLHLRELSENVKKHLQLLKTDKEKHDYLEETDQKIHDEKIGFYTPEEEADLFAVLLLLLSGLNFYEIFQQYIQYFSKVEVQKQATMSLHDLLNLDGHLIRYYSLYKESLSKFEEILIYPHSIFTMIKTHTIHHSHEYRMICINNNLQKNSDLYFFLSQRKPTFHSRAIFSSMPNMDLKALLIAHMTNPKGFQ